MSLRSSPRGSFSMREGMSQIIVGRVSRVYRSQFGLVGKDLEKYHVRTRDGYRLQQTKASQENSAESGLGPAAK